MGAYTPTSKVLQPSDNTLIYVLDGSYTTVAVIDTYESFIWTERYLEAGDFELYLPIDANGIKLLKVGNYLSIVDSPNYMIIENLQTESDIEDGDKLVVTGRTLGSVLDRRVIWDRVTLTGTFQNGVKKLLDDNVISPSVSDRAIPGFIFKTSTDGAIATMTLDTEYLGEGLYDAIVELCTEKDVGWRVYPSGAGGFQFELYAGVNHSYDQTERPYVVFSQAYDNLIGSKYTYTLENYKTVARVEGPEVDGYSQFMGVAERGAVSGLSRRETYTTASVDSDVTKVDASGKLTVDQISKINAILNQKGLEALAETSIDEAFEAEIDATRQFVHGEHFELGDIVQVEDVLGFSRKVRVSEVMRSWDTNGYTMTPTFVTMEEN